MKKHIDNFKKLKYYLDFPFLNKWSRSDFEKCIPLIGGIYVGWQKHQFDLYDTESFYPRGRKIGERVLSIHIGLFYWNCSLTIYNPKDSI